MRRSTLKLLAPASAVYIFFLIFLRSIIPEKLTPSVTLLALPLIILALILVSDLSNRAIVPAKNPERLKARSVRTRDVQFLTRQVQVASQASGEYFETIRSRLRALIIEKVSLQSGMEKENVKHALENRQLGDPTLIGLKLYGLLYGSLPARGTARVKMLHQAIDGIEAWKA